MKNIGLVDRIGFALADSLPIRACVQVSQARALFVSWLPLFRVKVKAEDEHLLADGGDRLIAVRRCDHNGLAGRRALTGLAQVDLNSELRSYCFVGDVLHGLDSL